MLASYRITPIAADHVPGLHAALDSVAREGRFLAFLEAPRLTEAQHYVRYLMEKGFPQFVALSEERVVGWCDIAPRDRPVYRHTGALGIGVIADFRRRGIGTDLMKTALDRAQQIGLTRIELTVRENNHPAINLYHKLGFTVEGVKRNAVRIDGVYENLLVMAWLRR